MSDYNTNITNFLNDDNLDIKYIEGDIMSLIKSDNIKDLYLLQSLLNDNRYKSAYREIEAFSFSLSNESINICKFLIENRFIKDYI